MTFLAICSITDICCVYEPVVNHIMSYNVRSTVQSSKHSLHSWNAEEMGSTSELIGLGVSARTFTDKEEGETHRARNV